MRLKTYMVVLGLLLCVAVAQGQVKSSGTINCAKPDVEHKIDVGGNHAFVLSQAKCSADKDKAFTIDGVKSGSGVSTNVTEAQGSKSTFHGYYVDTMENGDKGEYSFHGTALCMAPSFIVVPIRGRWFAAPASSRAPKEKERARVPELRMAPSLGIARANIHWPASSWLRASARAARVALFVLQSRA